MVSVEYGCCKGGNWPRVGSGAETGNGKMCPHTTLKCFQLKVHEIHLPGFMAKKMAATTEAMLFATDETPGRHPSIAF